MLLLSPYLMFFVVGYGLEVDMWAVGVITYILLCGFPPFRSPDRNQTELFEFIKAGHFEYLSPYWDDTSAGKINQIHYHIWSHVASDVASGVYSCFFGAIVWQKFRITNYSVEYHISCFVGASLQFVHFRTICLSSLCAIYSVFYGETEFYFCFIL